MVCLMDATYITNAATQFDKQKNTKLLRIGKHKVIIICREIEKGRRDL